MQQCTAYKIRSNVPRPRIDDIRATVNNELDRLNLKITHGSRIAVAVGSRGIRDLAAVVGETIQWLTRRGAQPFIVPAMGSHGGATAGGQEEILRAYGITEAAMGAPVCSSMDVVKLEGNLRLDVFMDRLAFESDGVVVINRIKPHTDFHGSFESGLAKMCVIGLGKHAQALATHAHGVFGLRELIPEAARLVVSSGKILCGIGIVENAGDRTMILEALAPADILAREPQLLAIARRNMARLPLDTIDVLIIDTMGKDISGVGIDTSVVGRLRIPGEAEPLTPKIKSIVVTDLSGASHGNAIGVGLADVISRKLFSKINFAATYRNAFTSSFLERAKIPVVAETDLEALNYGLRNCGEVPEGSERIVRIKDTLSLDELYVSRRALEDIADSQITLCGGPYPLFGPDSNLLPFDRREHGVKRRL